MFSEFSLCIVVISRSTTTTACGSHAYLWSSSLLRTGRATQRRALDLPQSAAVWIYSKILRPLHFW